ncbi:PREDICTED: fibrocystin isoform X5 [Gavialis gangeticus]|uniref:fibrocystin isoform X5 n=1 Tax=Gavialis gangeticus TaxID=94835 RepID=UPI00092EFAD1|nr:PREDICTED: fibrocystin isoform X5 [Gavialis gangeticus]
MNALIPVFLNVELLLLAVTSAKEFIDPREGSIAGGTWITLRLDDCLGLTSDQLSLWYSTNGSQLEVSLVNPTLPRVVCDVHPLHFDVSTIRCKTRSLLQEGVYHPEVTSNGQVISTSGRMTVDNCTFKFSVAQTPVVYQINPPSGVPGTLIEVYGQVIAGSYETMDFDTDYIDGPVILEAEDDGWISLCSFANKQNRSIYPIQREREMGTLKCHVEGSYIGSQNVSFSVFNKGKSVVHKDAWLISAKQELFLYQTHPEIVSVFPTSGSLGGGTRLTITGDFFDHPLKVTVAGVPCENRYISPWKIICITGPVDKTRRLSAPQPGNRGLLFEVWDDTVDTGLTEATPGYRWQFVPNARSPAGFLSQAKQPFRSRLRGFFVAPQTNNYTFWILADGKASLYLSLTEDPGSKVKIASLPAGVSQWSEHWEKNWNQSWQPKSQKFELTGGSRYYLEALHHGTAPSTGMRVGIQLHNTWLNPDVINTYHREKHEIQASAHQLPEIQMLTLSGTGWFSLSWDNVSSNMISTNATADQVQAVIEELLSVKCDTEPLSAKFLFRNGFEYVSDQKDFSTKGYVVSGVEPFCGRFSICSPKHLVRTSPPTLPRYDVTEYTHVCFAHKGYISNILHVLVSYSNAFLGTVKKNLTCHWSPQENSLERGTLPSQGSEEDDSLFASLENANISLRVQRLQTASPPIGGTFQILLPNTVISGVPIHISSHHLHKLLQSSTDNSTAHYFNASDFTVTKDSSTRYEAIWTLTWKAKTGDLPNVISVSAENLTGLNPTVAARVVYDGGVFIGPIFGDMLATFNNSTQVVVVVNEVLANCSGSCSFRYCEEVTPLVSDVEYLLDDRLHTKVFIRGSGFTADHQALRILVNDTTCNVTASNQTDLVCQMKMLPVGLYWIMLLVRPYGFALNASTGGDIYLRIEPKLVAVEPSRASEIGGCPVILRGTGFDGISLVLFGSQVCPVNTNNSNSMRIECEVPSRGEEDFNVHVTLIAGCQSTVFANVFIYDPSLNPAIVALSRNRSSIAGGQMLQIGLSSFAAYTGSDVKVQIGDAAADILGKTARGLDVVLPGLAAGWYNVSVILNDILIGSNGVEPLIQYISEIFSIKPCCGSFLGGTLLTISGIGFSPNPALVSVTIDRQTCDVTHLMEEAIWCRTPPAAGSSHVQSQDISAQVLVFIGNRSTTRTPSLSLQSGNIAFNYQMASTPGVSAVEVEMRNGSLHLGIHGLNVTNSLAKLGDSACELMSQPTNESTMFSQCSLPLSSLEPGIYPIRVLQKQLGYANLTASLQDVRVTPQISTVFPSQGSACGGLVLTIFGFGLTSQRNSVRVSLGGSYSCEIKSSVYNMILCTLLPRDQSLGAWQLPEAYPVLNITVTVNGISSICLANCTLHLREEWTPSVDAVTWEINGTFTDVMLRGQRLVWATDEPVVCMGDQAPCHVTHWNETSVRCRAASVYAGEHTLSMPNSRRGQACFRRGSHIVSIAPYVLRFYPQHFGGNGGGHLTIEGAAFQGRSQPSVIIGNHPCLITRATYNVIQCTVPPGHGTKALWLEVNSLSYPLGEISYREEFTPAFLSLLPGVGLLLTVKVSGITAVESMRVSVGDSPCTSVNGNRTTLQCLAPQLPAGKYHIIGHDLLRGWASSDLTFISRLAVTSVHNNFGCLGGGAIRLHGTGLSPENTSVAICDAPCEMLGPATATDLSCRAPRLDASLAILCSLKHSSEDCQETGATYIKCDIRVTVGTYSVTGPAPYIYLCDDDILPWDHTTGDSPLPYFTGLFFSPKVERDEVLIYNSSCNITMETEAEMECEGANQPITAKITEIRKSWGQNTQRHARLRFCGPWSKSSSWLEGHPPQDGDNVTVERGQTLLLDTITGILNLLHVKGGKLLFGGPGPVGLHAHYILVSDGGKLQVGSPNAPFCCKAHIHLYGSLHTPTFFPFGAKFLAVRNGSLSIHGWVPNVVYTHLKSVAHVNDTRLVLAEPVDWQPGDEVIVSGTGPGDGERQEEIVTVEAVNNTELYLRSPLRFPHGFEEERMGGQHFSLSAVVALLSRRIVVQGNVTDERMSHLRLCAAGVSGDASGCLYKRSEKKLGSREMGAVVMMQAFQGEESHIRLEGVQFRHVGQAFQQHLSALTIAGTARLTDSYIRGCSIWDSFGRGLGISGTSDLRVDNNVFYNISGHGLLLGGWLEQANKIRRNILIGLSGTDGLSNLEAVSPAGIYIQAPANQIEGNMVCAAGDGYFFHLSPKGPSQMPVLSFSKNIAHSCTRYGLLVYPEYQPQRAASLGPVLFQSFMAWRNQGGAQIFRSSNLELQNFQIHSCKEFGIDIVESLGNTSVTNSLLLGHLGHKQNGSCMSAGLKTPKRRELLVSNTSFMNFDSSMCTAISTCSGCSRGQGGFTVRAERLKFLNSPNRVLFPFPHSAILEDLDGSITEQKGSHLLASLNILATSCVVSANFSQDAASSVCGKDVIFHRMSIGLKEAPDAPYNLTVTDNNNKTTTVSYVSDTLSNLYGWMALLLDKEAYTLTFDNPLFNKQLQYSVTFDNFADGNYLLMEHRNLSSNIEVTVLCGTRWGQPLQSLPSHIYHKSCDWFFNRKLGKLTYLVTGEDLIQVTFKEEERVSIPTPAPSDGILKWSMPESWSGVGRGWGGYNHSIPAPGEDVIILPNRAILVDTTLPPLRGLYVMGRLEFPVNSSNVLSAACVVVAGGELKVGTFHHPLERGLNLLIFLRASDGIHCDRLDGINVYPGTIGVYGKVEIHSAYPKRSWTHLGADIAPGNERILLADEVDWSHGGNIVISSSSYEPHQAEVVTVKEIRNHSIKIHERLLHRHIGHSHNTEDGRQLPLAAEVGLLTRSIQIKSDTVCAGRLLVGRFRNANGVEYAGALQLLNVELLNFGPSHLPAIEFRNVSQGSAVIASSIHQTCGGGIQSVASHGIVLRDNVMFSTVGPGIDLEGQNHSLTRNLIILSKQPEGSPDWVAGIKVNLVDGAYLLGNVVAGSERIAFHIKGQECSLARDQYIENVAHSSLHGVHLYRGDGFQNCTRITGFLSYKNYDYGVTFHLESSVVMDNMTLVDNAVGVLAVVVHRSFEQHCLRKEYIKFRTSVIVATSKTFDCIKDRIKPLSGDPTSRDRAPRSPQRGRIGILWPAFASDTSRWPDKPWHKIRNDASVSGIMKLQEVTFTGFTKSCYSDDMDICIMSNPDSTGIMHPITSEKMRMLHVNEKNKLYFHTLQASNEYEDMVFPEIRCESSRKALFKDLDGSALGLQPPVSVFPKSDLEWPQFYLHAGIYREDSKCVYKPSTQGYFCKETDHALLILESLEVDADGERPSPVVSVTGSFVDSFNAAASHSSCCSSGHPWSFYSVLPSNKLTKVCFAGPTPLAMRLHLISGQSFTSLFLAVFYNEPQSVHIFTQGKYIPSTSSFLSSDAVAGTNYFSFEDNLLYVLLRGDEPVEIYTSLSLLIAFTTAMTIGEEEQINVVPHLADFLQIGHELVRIVHNGAGSKSTLKVIAANDRKRRHLCPTMTSCMAFSSGDDWDNTWAGPTSMRRLRPSGTAPSSSMMIIEVGDPPSLVRNSLVPSLSNERLKSLANLLITAHQTGELQHVLDIPTDTLMLMWSASPSPEGSSGRNGSGLTPGSSLYARPYNISVQVQPSDGEMGKELPVQPQIIFLDKQGQRVETLGLPTEPWVIAAYLKGSSKAALKGHTTVEVQHGWACFTDLAVSSLGTDWYLVFTVSSPPGAKFTVESQPFTIFPIAMGEKSNPILAVVLSSVASVIVLGLFVFCWVKKSKSNSTETKTGRANAPQAENNIKPSLIHQPHNSTHVPPQRKQEENDRDVAGVEADMEANGKQGRRVGEVKEQHPQAFKAKSLGKMNIADHKMDSGEKSSVTKKCGDRYEPRAMTSPWDSFELQQLGLKELSEWKDVSQE